MIYGIGTDIVRVSRMAASLERFGPRFAQRCTTEREFAEFVQCARPAHFLAKRFAAKEAAVKAMGLGFRDGMSLRQIGVAHDGKGKPYLEYEGRARELLDTLGIGATYLSLADEEDYAIAYVIMTLAPRSYI